MKKLTAVILLVLLATSIGCSGSPEETIDTQQLVLLATSFSDSNGPWEGTVETIDTQYQAFLDATVAAPAKNAYTELVRLHEGTAPDETILEGDQGLAKLDAREDTADFRLPALLSILIRYGDSGLLTETFKTNAKSSLLGFKYWPDELEDYPRYDLHDDGMDDMCYWSENHYILFSSGAYLAAQLYPDETFTASGETGAERMLKFKTRILKWLTLRYRSGFSEWLSNVYYNEDIPALLALIDLAEDEEIYKKATLVLDLLIADMALNHCNGTFGSTHGRTYTQKMSGNSDSTGAAYNLLFGLNNQDVNNYSACMLAVSEKYQMPKVLYEMARDTNRSEFINKQRMSIAFTSKLALNFIWGLNCNSLEDGMSLLTFEAYAHCFTINLFKDMLDSYIWWDNGQFAAFKDNRSIIEDPTLAGAPNLYWLAWAAEKDLTRNMRPEVNIYTYRTPDYMLSTAQDWRKGYGGDQQSIWQATLGTDATCFVTHPGIDDPTITGNPSPSYWTGNGTLPRAIQVKNVVISLYDISSAYEANHDEPALYFTDLPIYTHAYLPRGHYDEIDDYTIPSDGGYWIFARKGDGYLALYTKQAYTWETNADDADHGNLNYEVKALGEQNVWICELGRQADYTSFTDFKAAIIAAALTVTVGATNPLVEASDKSAISVSFESPSQGLLEMAWDGYLTQNGSAVNVRNYKRYENPYGTSSYPANSVEFNYNGESLQLDFNKKSRVASTLLIP